MAKLTLIQPLCDRAEDEGKGHIYFPGSLAIVAGRLQGSGKRVAIQDANVSKLDFTDSEVFGINLIGAPYIPVALKLRDRICETVGKEAKIIMGGQVISGLSSAQFSRLFGFDVINGMDETALRLELGIWGRLPSREKTSLIAGCEVISPELMKQYLSHEISFYLSQGCGFDCDFCAAEHTLVDPTTQKVAKKVRETYRDLEIVEKDLQYLVKLAKGFGINRLSIYLTNLDLFQSPAQLQNFADLLEDIKLQNSGFSFDLRGLCTTSSFMNSVRKKRKVIEDMVEAGLTTIGFGIDGATPEIWESVRKSQNNEDECLESIRISKQEFGITPEILMVVGHAKDTPESLEKAYRFTADMVEEYGAVPRPYVAKDIVPGNAGWKSAENAQRIQTLIDHPEAFQCLDFEALANPISHTSAEARDAVNRAYLQLTSLQGNTSNVIHPQFYPGIDTTEAKLNKENNLGKFDR